MSVSVEKYFTHNYPTFEKLPSLARLGIISLFKKLFHEDEVNDVLAKNRHLDAFDFIEFVLEYFNIDITICKNQLSRIPSYGRVVIIANHPLGALDSLALLHVIKDVRKDIKIVASNFLSEFKNLDEILIPIENIKGKMQRNSIESIYKALENEQVVIIFPSGEVSRARPNGIKDTKWKKGFLKIAQNTKSPILPIYIDAKNSKTFYLLSMINKSLATATIPHEMFKYYNKNIAFTIGKCIPFESYHITGIAISDRVKLFRKHFYKIAKKEKGIFKTDNGIALAENRQELKKELQNAKSIGETIDGKKIYLYANAQENVLIKEIGRLREISFRQVKEGSQKSRDIDDFDFCYEHIILWDDKDLEIVGSYRIVKASEMVDAFGVEGLYTSTLFEYKEEFNKYLSNSIELGRSFIQPKYWNSRALDYLWQGIGAYLKSNYDIRYLFGCVSISNSYSDDAIALLVFFYMNYFGAKVKSVEHRESYVLSEPNKKKCNELFFKDSYEKDILILKHELKLMGYSIPTLYKLYSELCDEGGVEFMDFGRDRDFENCIDGFLVIDADKLKPLKRKRYL
ncbi:MAG: GNAT family N-acetyltransferase [Sulfurimonas sp. RIFOXYD12_FULL_33_39]|uniref:lysophospholipid acyltransferase family protein n=1 Tax=unclassified Sulfurimonas TaxID=2623549 RepID=UPI0008C3CF91|nr:MULTISPECIES: lysophospholipid acyltransferase family protein [unclassified Sulfurimonas]OHE04281.1 MAG: GNAT family N-acetyltransferase [Sulfurimonas sp. RIFCSPLOWO2_12_FULL_34_6]OHE09719.1 MAG: GNAT family N-acetyltransferase [Sulfurimonas sp. RIFOXYD12_FULL_33_39]OHE13773.1 MAG: GNAT family N-acetyltransferase [Sulfurimonas sp. RIFOXYD2_FULL_34_21]DAB28697.1 MAG TPA: GNAT family N-acetyltransferase [Sulfurimonas sp. UBA10385]